MTLLHMVLINVAELVIFLVLLFRFLSVLSIKLERHSSGFDFVKVTTKDKVIYGWTLHHSITTLANSVVSNPILYITITTKGVETRLSVDEIKKIEICSSIFKKLLY